MKIVIQRVLQASVKIEEVLHAEIGKGLLLLVGFGPEDGPEDVQYAVRKITNMRIFADEHQKMNRSIQDIQGEILSVSQFTLFADTKKGNRPAFTGAATPSLAKERYEEFNQALRAFVPVKTGVFAADMAVSLINDGPVTILLDTKQR